MQARTVDSIVAELTEPDRLHGILAKLETDELADALERLIPLLGDLPYEANAPLDRDPAVLGLPVLLDQLRRMPHQGPRQTPPNWLLAATAHHLLRRITEGQREAAARAALSKTTVVSARILMVRMLGHEPQTGTKLISEAAGNALEAELRDFIVALPVADWQADPMPLALARLVVKSEVGRSALAVAVEDDRVFINILGDASGVTTSQGLGAAAVQLTSMLSWDFLVELVGEQALARRISKLQNAVEEGSVALSDDETRVLALAVRYASGWRPDGLMQALMRSAMSTPPGEPESSIGEAATPENS